MPVPGKGQTYTSDGGGTWGGTGTGKYGWETLPDWVQKNKQTVANYQNKQNSTPGIGQKVLNNQVTTGKNKAVVNPPTTKNNTSSSSSATYDGTGVGAGANATWDDIIEKIKALLNQQKTSADAYQKSLYEQALETARQSALNNQRQANRNYYAQNRRIGEMYGNDRSGMPMTQRFAAYSNLNNALAANDRDYANAKQTALTNYNSGLANNASTLAQGWYNYVLPVYTNRQQAIDNLNFYKSTL